MLKAGLLLVLAALTVQGSKALAQEAAADSSSDIVSEELGAGTATETAEPEEAPPKPEYPYPGAVEDDFKSRKKQSASSSPLPRPIKIDPDTGEYNYGTDLDEVTPKTAPGTDAPSKASKTGEYLYEGAPKQYTPSGRAGIEAPVSVSKLNEFQYATEVTPQTNSISVRLGAAQPPNLQNPDNKFTYEQIYGDGYMPVILGDYEWRLTSSIGRLGLKAGSGIMVSQGNGRFKTNNALRTEVLAEERMTFITFPNTATLIYKFQYAEKQIIVPFVEGGAGVFTFAEIRDDNRKPKFGAALAGVAAGGLNFLMDWLDERSVRNLDNEYGINHVWLTTEFRYVAGLNSEFDFSSSVINAGFMVEF